MAVINAGACVGVFYLNKKKINLKFITENC